MCSSDKLLFSSFRRRSQPCRPGLGLLALAAVLLFAPLPARAVSGYHFKDLGPGAAVGINTDGAVLVQGAGNSSSYVWIPASPNGELTGSIPTVPNASDVLGINDSLHVLYVPIQAANTIWDVKNNVFIPVGQPSNTSAQFPAALNNLDGVVGTTLSVSAASATWWPSGGGPVFLDVSGISGGAGLNNTGAFVGGVEDNNHVYHATEWAFVGFGIVPITLNREPGVQSQAFAINDSGTSIGYLGTPALGNLAPVSWDKNGVQTNLPDLPAGDGHPAAINSGGSMVGGSYQFRFQSGLIVRVPVAALWSGGQVTDLNNVSNGVPSGWSLQYASGINTAGQIVGSGLDASGGGYAFLLSPFNDNTAPTTTVALNPSSPNGTNGWYTVPVGLQFTATDPDDASATLTTSVSFDGAAAQATTTLNVSGDGLHTVTYSSKDPAGNTEVAKSVSFKIDRTLPVVLFTPTPAPNANGWNNSSVSMAYTATDATSGLASANPPGPVALTSEGAGQQVSVTAVDNAGNTRVVVSPVVNIDLTPPSTTASVNGPAGSNGWFTGSAQVSLSASDNLSGVAQTNYSVDGGAAQLYVAAFTVSGDAIHTVSFWSVDKAGSEEVHSSTTVKIDSTPPTLAFGSPTPAPNAAGWNNTPVDIPYTTADNLSGVASSLPVSPLHFGADGANQTRTVTVTDAAGNTATFTSPSVSIDTTPPTITAAASRTELWPPNGKMVPVTISGNIGDATSGILSSSAQFAVTDSYGSVQRAGAITLGPDGSYSFTVSLEASRRGQDKDGRTYTITITAVDPAGNPAIVTVLVSVPHDQEH
ncbi:MAG TPA: hypothetical protein VFJ58_09955 [Armatimonadota bacterium]|nr:hypothetical protein [Armatimonadota bacterium]